MSRTEAKRRFTLDDQIKAIEGVECRKDAQVIAGFLPIDVSFHSEEIFACVT